MGILIIVIVIEFLYSSTSTENYSNLA